MKKFLNNWGAMRIIRLVAGTGVGIYAITSKEYLFLIIAAMLIIQSVLNISCCGSRGCSTEPKKAKTEVYKDQIEQYKG